MNSGFRQSMARSGVEELSRHLTSTVGQTSAVSDSVLRPAPRTSSTVRAMQRAELERIKDLIDELRSVRHGASGDLYRHYSGAISSLRRILRLHGVDHEPG